MVTLVTLVTMVTLVTLVTLVTWCHVGTTFLLAFAQFYFGFATLNLDTFCHQSPKFMSNYQDLYDGDDDFECVFSPSAPIPNTATLNVPEDIVLSSTPSKSSFQPPHTSSPPPSPNQSIGESLERTLISAGNEAVSFINVDSDSSEKELNPSKKRPDGEGEGKGKGGGKGKGKGKGKEKGKVSKKKSTFK